MEHLSELQSSEGTGYLFHGTRRTLKQFKLVTLPDGRSVIALRTGIPRSFNHETGQFESHSSVPVVCAVSVASYAIFHALSAAAAESGNVPPQERRRGILSDVLDDEGKPAMVTTQAIIEQVPYVTARLIRVRAATFHPYFFFDDGTPFEYRSVVPVEFDPENDVAELNGRTDWPDGVRVVEPYPVSEVSGLQ